MATYYASPSGTGNGASISTPFKIADFWAIPPAPGDTLNLIDGIYTGANSMIHPVAGLSGTSGSPITIRAINDGEVLIDGDYQYEPIRFYQNSWFVVEGINARNGSYSSGADQSVVYLSGASDNNIFRRVGAWDARDTPDTDDPNVWAISSSSNNLFEDCFGFGSGKYVFYVIAYTGPADNNIARRCWFRFDQGASSYSDPRAVMLPNYTGSENTLVENCILEWRANGATTYQTQGPEICLEGSGFNGYGDSGVLRLRGCLFFVGPNFQSWIGGSWGMALRPKSHNTELEELTIYIDPANAVFGYGIYAAAPPDSPYNGYLDKILTIGTYTDNIHASWGATNYNHYSSIGSVPDPYVYLTDRWVDGVKTSIPMWPWPMNQRIIDATTSTSWPVADVNTDVQAILGTYSAGATPSVACDGALYQADAEITVTVDNGLFGTQEWAALYLAGDPDSAYSYLGNWMYLDGTQVEPGSPPSSYPVVLTFIAPLEVGSYNIRYFAENAVGNRLAISDDFTVEVATGGLTRTAAATAATFSVLRHKSTSMVKKALAAAFSITNRVSGTAKVISAIAAHFSIVSQQGLRIIEKASAAHFSVKGFGAQITRIISAIAAHFSTDTLTALQQAPAAIARSFSIVAQAYTDIFVKAKAAHFSTDALKTIQAAPSAIAAHFQLIGFGNVVTRIATAIAAHFSTDALKIVRWMPRAIAANLGVRTVIKKTGRVVTAVASAFSIRTPTWSMGSGHRIAVALAAHFSGVTPARHMGAIRRILTPILRVFGFGSNFFGEVRIGDLFIGDQSDGLNIFDFLFGDMNVADLPIGDVSVIQDRTITDCLLRADRAIGDVILSIRPPEHR